MYIVHTYNTSRKGSTSVLKLLNVFFCFYFKTFLKGNHMICCKVVKKMGSLRVCWKIVGP